MDQTNPLSEVTHKRRLSALGPGGLTRERAGFEVRDVHADPLRPHLPDRDAGRSEHRPHRVALHVRARQRVRLRRDALPQGRATAASPTRWMVLGARGGGQVHRPGHGRPRREGQVPESLVSARFNGDFKIVTPEMVQLMDVAPNQMVSVAAALVPFLEHDDANRALMGANMQRQAVPLIRTHAPLVGTGMEGRLARDSGVCVVAKRAGIVESVDASRIVVRAEGDGAKCRTSTSSPSSSARTSRPATTRSRSSAPARW